MLRATIWVIGGMLRRAAQAYLEMGWGRQKKRVHQCGISENTVFQNNTEPQHTRDQADRLTLSDTLAKLVAFAGKTREIGPSQIIPKNLTWKSYN